MTLSRAAVDSCAPTCWTSGSSTALHSNGRLRGRQANLFRKFCVGLLFAINPTSHGVGNSHSNTSGVRFGNTKVQCKVQLSHTPSVLLCTCIMHASVVRLPFASPDHKQALSKGVASAQPVVTVWQRGVPESNAAWVWEWEWANSKPCHFTEVCTVAAVTTIAVCARNGLQQNRARCRN